MFSKDNLIKNSDIVLALNGRGCNIPFPLLKLVRFIYNMISLSNDDKLSGEKRLIFNCQAFRHDNAGHRSSGTNTLNRGPDIW